MGLLKISTRLEKRFTNINKEFFNNNKAKNVNSGMRFYDFNVVIAKAHSIDVVSIFMKKLIQSYVSKCFQYIYVLPRK